MKNYLTNSIVFKSNQSPELRSVRIKILSHILLIMIGMAFSRANVSLYNSFVGTSFCDENDEGKYGAYVSEDDAETDAVKPIYDSNSLLMMVQQLVVIIACIAVSLQIHLSKPTTLSKPIFLVLMVAIMGEIPYLDTNCIENLNSIYAMSSLYMITLPLLCCETMAGTYAMFLILFINLFTRRQAFSRPGLWWLDVIV